MDKIREESYVRALMYLGPLPREPKRIGPGSVARKNRREIEAYMKSNDYNMRVQKYWIDFIFGPGPEYQRLPDWIEGFYDWQRRANNKQPQILSSRHTLHACNQGERA